MPRMPRAVLPEVAHHLTHRGVNREPIFQEDFDRRIYLDLVAKQAKRLHVSLMGYLVMSNHVHGIAVPAGADGLAKAFGEAHGRYAQYANARFGRHGHFWQDRFFSCALDPGHRWVALRYVERNPLRAGLVAQAAAWRWSSAAVPVSLQRAPAWLALDEWAQAFTPTEWQRWLDAEDLREAELARRRGTATGRPVGDEAFVQDAEARLPRRLHPEKGGRPRKAPPSPDTAPSVPAQPTLWAAG